MTVRLFVSLIFLVLGGCCPRISMVDVGPLERQETLARLTTAHRGNLHIPERSWDNSLVSLREAISEHVPLLEVDVRLSDEGDLFLFHDGSAQSHNSYAPAELRGRPIQSLTKAERARITLDADGKVAIPLLTEALDLVVNSQSALQFDLKGESDTLAFAVLDLVARRGMLPKVVVQLKSSERIVAVKKRHPTARIVARCLSMEQLDKAIASHVEFVELERWISSEAVRKGHHNGIKVLINIASSRLDEPSTWEYLRSRGVDVIMTDFADRAL